MRRMPIYHFLFDHRDKRKPMRESRKKTRTKQQATSQPTREPERDEGKQNVGALTKPGFELLDVTRPLLTWNNPSGSSSSVWVDSKQNTRRLGTSIKAERSGRSWSNGREREAKQGGQRHTSRKYPVQTTNDNSRCGGRVHVHLRHLIPRPNGTKKRAGKRTADGTKRVLGAASATRRRKIYARSTTRGWSTNTAGRQRGLTAFCMPNF